MPENQPEFLYRFRSTKYLLGENYNELEDQQIYFPTLDKLNDPLEGNKDIFWCGDDVVWYNLLRHYLLNLMTSYFKILINGKNFNYKCTDTSVYMTDQDLQNDSKRKIFSDICNEFFHHAAGNRMIEFLSTGPLKINRAELIFYLSIIHPLALRSVYIVYNNMKPAIEPDFKEKILPMLNVIVQQQDKNQQDHFFQLKFNPEVPKILYIIIDQFSQFDKLDNTLRKPIPTWEDKIQYYISKDFTNYYVDSLSKLIHPTSYIACFSADYINPSMWSIYADSHKGVCLKFKTRNSLDGKQTIDLYRKSDINNNAEKDFNKKYSLTCLDFTKVDYNDDDVTEIDFFESLLKLTMSQLEFFWFAPYKGKKSNTALRMRQEEDQCRKDYWEKLRALFSVKSKYWSYEGEYRLILNSTVFNYEEDGSRKFKYRFEDLSGIIFGINTTIEDKKKIIEIIRNKCRIENRKEFDFYQSYYSYDSRKLRFLELPHIFKMENKKSL